MSHTILAKLDSDLISEISSLKNESDWLRKYRNESLQTYENLPLETSNLYTKYTDAARMDPEIVKIAAKSDGAIPAFLQNRIKELKDIPHIVQIGTNIHNVHLPSKMKEQGVRICHIDEALADGTAKKNIESSDTSEDRFTALNSAAFNSGIYIEIPKNVQVADPIHIISCLSDDGVSVISRNVISAAQSSSSSIVQEMYSPKSQGQQAYMELLTTDVQQNALTSFQSSVIIRESLD